MAPLPASCSARERGEREAIEPRTKKAGGVWSAVGKAHDGHGIGVSHSATLRISSKVDRQDRQTYS